MDSEPPETFLAQMESMPPEEVEFRPMSVNGKLLHVDREGMHSYPTENTTNLQFSATVPKGEYPARQLFLKVRTGSKVGAGDFPANRHIVGERELQFPLEHYGSFEVEHTPRWKPKKPSLANHSFYAFKCKQDHDYVELEFVRREDAAPLEGPGPEKFTLVFKGEREETRAQIAVVIPNSDDGDAAAV